MRTCFLGAAPCALVLSFAGAQLVLTADERALSVEAAGQTQTASPVGAFPAFIRDLNLDVPSGSGDGRALASQDSSVSASAMHATGSSSAESHAGPASCVLSQATSDFRIGFNVTTPVQYSIEGSVNGAQFRLTESVAGGGGVVHMVQTNPGMPMPYSFSGILKPGRNYLLLAQSSQLANACNNATFSLDGDYSLNASFTSLAPCPGDLNFDRFVNDDDFQIFLVAYNALLCPDAPAPCDADLNGDGFVNDDDFQVFLVGYNALLCP